LWHVGDGADSLPAGRYPIRTGEGRRLAVRLARAGAQAAPRIAGLTPLPLDPAWPVEDLSTRLGGPDGPA
ncbi:MAG: hypothetical protein ACP5EN_15280, partial [Rhodovulum sp.]